MQTIVVGGSGMIGRAIQREIRSQKETSEFTFSYKTNKLKIPSAKNLYLDLFDQDSTKQLRDFSRAIYLAGNTDHGLASKDPTKDAQLNIEAFLNFTKFYKGTLVLFSSQAVYYGHKGKIKEDAAQRPTIPYGISRHAAEMYAEYFKQAGKFSSLAILRPTYVFGEGEKERRLIPRCARAAIKNDTLTVFGKGQSFLNPLPVEFVARVAVRINQEIASHEHDMSINLNHPDPMTVLELVQTLQDAKPFRCVVEEGGEEWPALHYGNANFLLRLLKQWRMEMPDVKRVLRQYFMSLTEGKQE